MGSKLRSLSIMQKLIVVLLFFAGMNFVQKCFYFIYAAFIVTVFLHCRKLKIGIGGIILFFFSMLYLLFYPEARENIMQIIKHLAYPVCYVIGLNFISDNNLKYEREQILIFAIISVGMGPFVHYMLNMINNIGSVNRNTIDIWTNEVMSATGQAMMAVIAVGIFSATMFTAKKWEYRLIAVLGMVIAVGYNLVLAGRTILVLSASLMVFSYFYTKKHNNKKIKKKNKFMILGLITLLVIFYNTNFGGMRTIISNSNFLQRIKVVNDIEKITRTEIKMEYLKLTMKYPFGGSKIRQVIRYYAHDLFLDTYNEAGFFACLILIIFIVYSLVVVIKKIRQGIWSVNFRTLILCVYIGFFVGFLTEPILSGMPWMFCVFCFYQGAISNKETITERYK